MDKRSNKMKRLYSIFLVILSTVIHGVDSAPCLPNTKIGSDPSSNNNEAADAAYGSFLVDPQNQAGYVIDCCGVVESVDYWASSTGSFTVQIWDVLAGTVSTLRGEETITVATAGSLQNTPLVNPISINNDYRFGWYGNPNVLKYKNAGGSAPERLTKVPLVDGLSTTAVGSTFDWNTATDVTNVAESPAFQLVLSGGNLPVITSSAGNTITLNSADAAGTAVTTVAATDIDAGDILTAITMTSTTTDIAMTGTTVSVTGDLSGPSRTETLTFSVTDLCGNIGTLPVTVNIINDPFTIENLPAFEVLNEDVTIKTLIKTITATDTDDVVSCAMDGSTAALPFTVEIVPPTTNYGIYSIATPGFDYDTLKKYELLINCDDAEPSNTQQNRAVVYLTKNSAPTITNVPATVPVSTTTTATNTVFTVSATDAEGDSITYSMSCPNDPTCPYTISATTGAITLTSDISASKVTGYDIYVTVNDAKNAATSAKIVTIIHTDINDDVAISNLPLTANYPVNENTAILTPKFTVTAKDQDTAQTLVYSMTSTADGLTYFQIDPSNGEIKTGLSTLNYESLAAAGTTSYTLSVSVTDGVFTDTETLVIDIIDVNEAPQFSQTSYSLTTNEGPANTVIGTPNFNVIDPDAGDSHIYDMNCGNGYFFMDSSTGQVRLQSDYDLDQGLPSSVTCTVTVVDAGGLTDISTLIISIVDINDHTPTFLPSQYMFMVDYYSGVTTLVGTVTASDGDSALYGTLTYALDQTSLPQEYFQIQTDGTIVLKNELSSLGYGQRHIISALVYDSGGLVDTATVEVVIGDTTTVPATTTGQRYRKFAEDSKNMPWLVFSIVTIIVSGCFLIWVICTCKGKYSLLETLKTWRIMRRMRPRPQKKKENNPPPQQYIDITIRRAPGPKDLQLWRTGQGGAPAGYVDTNI